MTDLILYTTEDSPRQIKLRAQEQTVWLTQLEIGELFDATKQNLSPHLKNIFEDAELGENSVVKDSLTTQMPPGCAATVKQSLTVQTEGTGELNLKFDQDRKRAEAIETDQRDGADLTALETKIKRRPKK